jgi:hypothetical protein
MHHLSHSFSGALRTFAYFMASGTQYTLEGVNYLDLYGNDPSAIEQVYAIFASGYRPIYDVRADYWTSVHHEFPADAEVVTGGRTIADVWFLNPEAYPHADLGAIGGVTGSVR